MITRSILNELELVWNGWRTRTLTGGLPPILNGFEWFRMVLNGFERFRTILSTRLIASNNSNDYSMPSSIKRNYRLSIVIKRLGSVCDRIFKRGEMFGFEESPGGNRSDWGSLLVLNQNFGAFEEKTSKQKSEYYSVNSIQWIVFGKYELWNS